MPSKARPGTFQFPIRNSVRSDPLTVMASFGVAKFQFPIRNSVRSDVGQARIGDGDGKVSIPHSEFCSFGPHCSPSYQSQMMIVSIPHSEFCSFGPGVNLAGVNLAGGFNSPFGILFVRTSRMALVVAVSRTFQFPIRNSVRSDPASLRRSSNREPYVSIPHSEFCSFGLDGPICEWCHDALFQFPIRNSVRSDFCLDTRIDRGPGMFQFPIRNSVRSDVLLEVEVRYDRFVSIPHSEFCSFGPTGVESTTGVGSTFQFPIRNSVRSDLMLLGLLLVILIVSIPHSEFCSFGLTGAVIFRLIAICSFNSPFGILFVRTQSPARDRLPRRACFNSPFGILFVRTRDFKWPSPGRPGVSIPHSEFCSFGLLTGQAKGRIEMEFQFPIRNSVRSDNRHRVPPCPGARVSIPHSEFCSFGRTEPYCV